MMDLKKEAFKQLRKIEDPGHGWLEVPARLYLVVSKQHDWKASDFSYYDPEGDTVYLEEDCDMPAYLSKMPGTSFRYEHEENTFVRNLPGIETLHASVSYCLLCGQRIRDGKLCHCGATPVKRACYACGK